MSPRLVITCVVSVVLFARASVVFAATFFGPSPYLESADSPFAGTGFSYFYLEDFEDGIFNTPGVTVNPGGTVTGPGPEVDSVDADDGVIDGLGQNGHSYYSFRNVTVFTFTFDLATLGALPTHAGIVWTDKGLPFPLVDEVEFEAFDTTGISLGTIGPVSVGDNSTFGGTAEDRFFGVRHDGGILKIEIRSLTNSDDWEIDHLQYGREGPSIPTVSDWGLIAMALLVLTAGTLVHARRRPTPI